MERLAPGFMERLLVSRARFESLSGELADPATFNDTRRAAELGREQSELAESVEHFEHYLALIAEVEQAEDLAHQPGDDGMKELAADELAELQPRLAQVVGILQELLMPRDPNDARDVIMEIRGAEGGEEANLWAGDLMRMYMRYAELRVWKVEVLNTNETNMGGIREVTFEIHGKGVYSRLKWEGGTHRVQRVPVTEAQGRIHTSTATVHVLPKADELDVQIKEEDVRVDVYRAGGHGGQGVNTTDSAVRLTHVPSGLVVTCQDERSQIKNKARAMEVLRSRLYELELRKQQDAAGALRKSQVGSGERAEKIRTYNFRENRVTDHRINVSLHNLDRMLTGELDQLLDAVADAARKEDALDSAA